MDGSPPDALAAARAVIAQLEEALASRSTTAEATGLLAARYSVTTDEAWMLLREFSMMSNQKALQVARVLVAIHNAEPLSETDRTVAVAVQRVFDRAVDRAVPVKAPASS